MRDLFLAIRERRLEYLFLFVGFFAILVYIQFNALMGDPDGFYHAAMAEFLSRGVILKAMPWMQATTLRSSFTDHHFLYHVFLVPFVLLGKPLLAVKLATAAFTASFFTVLYWTLRKLRGAGPLLATLALFFSNGFLFRLSLVKANSLSLIVLCLLLVTLFERRWWLLALLNAIYVWLYGGWILGIVVAAIYAFVSFVYTVALARGFSRHRILSRIRFPRMPIFTPIVATVTGNAAGLIVNPYWPQNIPFYWQQVWQIAIVNQGRLVNVGGEWTGLTLYDLFNNLGYVAIAGAIALVLCMVQAKRLTHRSWTALALMLLFVALMCKSRRYIELAAPVMVIAGSLLWEDVFPKHMLASMWRSLQVPYRAKKYLGIISSVIVLVLVALPNIGLWGRIEQVRNEIGAGIPLTRYQKASEWLSKNTLPESIVVHSDWDIWPNLFYYDRRNYYLVGLDPTFMYNYDAKLYNDWAQLTANGITSDLVDLVTRRLRARYILIEKDHTAFQQTVSQNIYFRLVYEDAETWVYRYAPAGSI